MFERASISAAAWCTALAALLSVPLGAAKAFDDAKYPNLKGQWTRLSVPGIEDSPSFDPTKRSGLDQQAPLTPEYRKIYEAGLVEQAAGGRGTGRSYSCLPLGMPMVMQAYEPMEIIVAADATHIFFQNDGVHRRIFTDGRTWPKDVEPAFFGYSIGKWSDGDGDGRFDTLTADTRYFKGPRVFDATGIPLHEDNETVIKERIYLDKANADILHDEITVEDHALTHPWTVNKQYRRATNPRPLWHESVCEDTNRRVLIGDQVYTISTDGLLMPASEGQPGPDLKFFFRRSNR
jgi:hypothetical protein